MDENRDPPTAGAPESDGDAGSSPSADRDEGGGPATADPDGSDAGAAPESEAPSATEGDAAVAPGPDDDRTDGPVYDGWWRYPPAAWLGLVTAPAGVAILLFAGNVDAIVLGTFLGFVGTALLAGPLLALALGSLLSFGSVFWGSLRYRDDPDVEWTPRPVVYLLASLLLTPLLVGGVWFVQRVRHVGQPDFGTWI